MFIVLTTDFILAILRCNLAFCSNISLSCICCCSRLNSWFLLYRRDAALFWRMARWALCSFFCLTGNFEFLEGNGGREYGVSRFGRPFFGGILKGSAGKVLGIILGRGLCWVGDWQVAEVGLNCIGGNCIEGRRHVQPDRQWRHR